MRVGIGHDTHRLVQGRPLILGGISIPYDRGLAGHSDADVVLHAICDALLGALAMGDIGERFPDTDPRYRDMDSAAFVREAVSRVSKAGWTVGNVDLVVHAEQPRLSEYKPAMRESIARLLGVRDSVVSVKAKTGEGVGPIGRGEAISCEAVVLLRARRSRGQARGGVRRLKFRAG